MRTAWLTETEKDVKEPVLTNAANIQAFCATDLEGRQLFSGKPQKKNTRMKEKYEIKKNVNLLSKH